MRRRCARGARRALLGVLIFVAATHLAAAQAQAGVPRGPSAAELFARALGHDDIAYTATRTSLFWSDDGHTRARVARVYKDGERVRYEYPSRGNRAAVVVIETPRAITFVQSVRGRDRITLARRTPDASLQAERVQLALANYTWRFEPSTSPGRRVVSAWRPGARYPSQRYWISPSSMVIVRSERYGPAGELRASWSLDAMHVVADLPDRLFETPQGPELEVRQVSLPEVVPLEAVRSRVGLEPVRLREDKIPAGYRLVDVSVERTEGHPADDAVRFVYSDGLDAFSLLERRRPPRASEKIDVSGAREVSMVDTSAQLFTSAEVSLVHWQDAQRQYTLMGAMPPRVLMALSLGVIASDPTPRATASARATVAVSPARRRTFGDIITRGWGRLLRMFGR